MRVVYIQFLRELLDTVKASPGRDEWRVSVETLLAEIIEFMEQEAA